MSDPTSAGGANPNPSGNGGSDEPQHVSLETHQKLLGEKKKAAAKAAQLEQELEAYRAKERERENADLEASKNFEQVKKNLEDQLKQERDQRAALENERKVAKKFHAFNKTLGAKIDEKFHGLIDLDQIAIDPTTGTVDEMSVANYVDAFRKTYPETLKVVQPNGLPSNAPQGNPKGQLTLAEWKTLPLAEKSAAIKDGRIKP